MKNVVISGSASLQKEIQKWKKHFEEKGCHVLNFPIPIAKDTFEKEYPRIHASFYKDIERSDIFFLMNEEKNGIKGYIGAAGISELSYAIIQNLVHHKKIQIFILNMPDKNVSCYDEIVRWSNLGWINFYK
ncbi:MAG: hypothetical protein LBU87_03925 [Lactobacillales bacterium]|jgi:hypothetical protein|nr:hypothetical protein [Lactobacillales bacterium]